jgi:hypothetical protein
MTLASSNNKALELSAWEAFHELLGSLSLLLLTHDFRSPKFRSPKASSGSRVKCYIESIFEGFELPTRRALMTAHAVGFTDSTGYSFALANVPFWYGNCSANVSAMALRVVTQTPSFLLM